MIQNKKTIVTVPFLTASLIYEGQGRETGREGWTAWRDQFNSSSNKSFRSHGTITHHSRRLGKRPHSFFSCKEAALEVTFQLVNQSKSVMSCNFRHSDILFVCVCLWSKRGSLWRNLKHYIVKVITLTEFRLALHTKHCESDHTDRTQMSFTC